MAIQAITYMYMQHDKLLTSFNKKLYGPLASINEDHSFLRLMKFQAKPRNLGCSTKNCPVTGNSLQNNGIYLAV